MEGTYCVIVAEDGRRGKGAGGGGGIFLEFSVQFNMSPVLGVRRWPYVHMFHIPFFLVISVQNTARRNMGRLQAKVIQRSLAHTEYTCRQTESNHVCVV